MRQALAQPWGKCFGIERKAGKITMADPASHFNGKTDYDKLTYDISNNKILANVGIQGQISHLSVYRDSYRVNCGDGVTGGWPGVWMAKDVSTYGPYSYTLAIDGRKHDLSGVDWDFRTGLLDNLFPVTELKDPQGRFIVHLLTYAPVSADGSERLRGVVYGLLLESLGDQPLNGSVILPKLGFPYRKADKHFVPDTWGAFDPFDFEIGAGDGGNYAPEISFHLTKGRTLWIPTVIYAPGEPVVEQIAKRGAHAWFAESSRYYRHILGRMTTAREPFLAGFYEREVMQALQSVAMSASGKIAGSNWGSYPATHQIWQKDCYYSCLPFMAGDAGLAQGMILWFDEFGVRQKGTVVEGGVSHSVSLSVAAPLLAGLYYEASGDKSFFQQHPQFRQSWGTLLDAVIASRKDKDVWLFPTRFISDGPVEGDYHVGSNVCVWRAVKGYARLLEEVYGDPAKAAEYAREADHIKASVLKTAVAGTAGPYLVESVWRDHRKPADFSDGEESDTTLMPFYGMMSYNDPVYINTMRFSAGPQNTNYNTALHAFKWIGVPSTAPGYNKALCAAMSREELFGEHGAYNEFRRVADADGSVWWWSYGGGGNPEYGKVIRGYEHIGKSGWAAGVHSSVFPSRFLGVEYDAPERLFRFAPTPWFGDFSWSDFPVGNDRFSVGYERKGDTVHVIMKNPNRYGIRLEAMIPVATDAKSTGITINGKTLPAAKPARYLGYGAVPVSANVGAGGTVEINIP